MMRAVAPLHKQQSAGSQWRCPLSSDGERGVGVAPLAGLGVGGWGGGAPAMPRPPHNEAPLPNWRVPAGRTSRGAGRTGVGCHCEGG